MLHIFVREEDEEYGQQIFMGAMCGPDDIDTLTYLEEFEELVRDFIPIREPRFRSARGVQHYECAMHSMWPWARFSARGHGDDWVVDFLYDDSFFAWLESAGGWRRAEFRVWDM